VVVHFDGVKIGEEKKGGHPFRGREECSIKNHGEKCRFERGERNVLCDKKILQEERDSHLGIGVVTSQYKREKKRKEKKIA